MITNSHLKLKTLALLIGLLTTASAFGCGSKRTKPPIEKPVVVQYIVCISDPIHGVFVCNKTGKAEDNYPIAFLDTDNYRCMPESDWVSLQQELTYLRTLAKLP